MSRAKHSWTLPATSNIHGILHYDLAEKMAYYSDQGKVCRLRHIASNSRELYIEALSLAYQYSKDSSKDIQLAKSIARSLNSQGIAVPDGTEWITERENSLFKERESLTDSIENTAWSSGSSSVSEGYKKLATLLFEMGDLEGCKVNILKFRDTISPSNNEGIVESLLFEATVNFFSARTASTSSLPFVSRLSTIFLDRNGSLSWPGAVKVGAICGITTLQQEKYREAASVLLKISPEYVSTITDIASPQDLALYITLSALASFSRSELQFLSSADQGFQSFSEGSTQNLSELIEFFLNSKYKEFLTSLETFKPDYEADPFLFPILESLLGSIKKRALLQYLSVYRNVSLQLTAETFLLTSSQLEELLKIYITEGVINVLIDQRSGMLSCREVDEDYEKLVHTTRVTDQYLNGCRVMLNTLV